VRYIFYPWGENFPRCLLAPLQSAKLAPGTFTLKEYQQALQANRLKFLPLTARTQDLPHKYLGASVSIARPDYDPRRTPKVSWNDRSLSLCVEWPNGQTSLLFGDTRAKALPSLYAKPVFADCWRKADYLLANHHGRAQENSDKVLAQMRALRGDQPLELVAISSQTQNPEDYLNAERIRLALNARAALRTAFGDIVIDCSSARSPCA
jgi:hypothetical protein